MSTTHILMRTRRTKIAIGATLAAATVGLTGIVAATTNLDRQHCSTSHSDRYSLTSAEFTTPADAPSWFQTDVVALNAAWESVLTEQSYTGDPNLQQAAEDFLTSEYNSLNADLGFDQELDKFITDPSFDGTVLSSLTELASTGEGLFSSITELITSAMKFEDVAPDPSEIVVLLP